MRNKEVIERAEEERNILDAIKRRNDNLIGWSHLA